MIASTELDSVRLAKKQRETIALLERRRDAAPGFRAVAAACELVLVIERIAPSEIDASGTVDAKALFQDPATKQLYSMVAPATVIDVEPRSRGSDDRA